MAVKTNGAILVEPDPNWHQAHKGAQKLNLFAPAVTESDAETVKQKPGDALSDARAQKAYTTVGRPTNGIIAKPNTHAFVQVLGPDGNVLSCFNNIGMHNQSNKSREGLLHASGYYLADRAAHKPGEFSALGALNDAFNDLKTGLGFGDDPKTKPPTDVGGNNLAPIWTDWILQSVHESRVEKTQVVETFGDSYFYVFGQRPRSIAFSGLLMNTQDYNWRAVFWKNWDEFFRATKLVERGATLYIQWDDIIVAGYPVNAMCNEVADSPNAMRFSFNLFVTDYINMSSSSGFLTQRYMRIAQLRAGSGLGYIDRNKGWRLMGGEGFDPRAFNYRKTEGVGGLDSVGGGLVGLEGLLGLRPYRGAQFQKFSLSESVLDAGGLGNYVQRQTLGRAAGSDFVGTRTGQALMRNLGYVVSASMKGWILGGDNANARDQVHRRLMFNSMFRQISKDMAIGVAQDVSNFLEDSLDVRRGEINRWMGWYSTLPELGDGQREANGDDSTSSANTDYSSMEAMVTGWINDAFSGEENYFGGTYVGSDGVTRSYGSGHGGVTMVSRDGAVIKDLPEFAGED